LGLKLQLKLVGQKYHNFNNQQECGNLAPGSNKIKTEMSKVRQKISKF